MSKPALPESWVDSIFKKLTVRYGQQFLGRWAGVDLSDVKADWAEQLAVFANRPQCIAYAFDNLPYDAPPNAGQFRKLCSSMPDERRIFKALPIERTPMPAEVRAKFDALLGRMKSST